MAAGSLEHKEKQMSKCHSSTVEVAKTDRQEEQSELCGAAAKNYRMTSLNSISQPLKVVEEGDAML